MNHQARSNPNQQQKVKWGIGRKLAFAFGTMVLLIVIVGASAMFGLKLLDNSLKQAFSSERKADLANAIHLSFMEALRNEKNYVLRYKNDGFEEAEKHYVYPVKKAVKTIRNHVDNLLDHETHEENISKIKEIDSLIRQYESNFLIVVNAMEKRGFKDTGLEGKLRNKMNKLENIIEKDEIANSKDVHITLLQLRRHEKNYIMRLDEKSIDRVHTLAEQLKTNLVAIDLSEDEKMSYGELIDTYIKAFDNVVTAEGKIANSIASFLKVNNKILKVVEELRSDALNEKDDAIKKLHRFSDMVKSIIIGTILLSFISGLFVTVTMSRKISNSINPLTQVANSVAAGNLDVKAEVKSKDEIGILARTFNQMTDNLGKIIEKVKGASARIASASSEIAATMEQMTQGANSQANQIIKTSSAMEEMSSSIQEVSYNARNTSDTALAASSLAREGLENVRDTVGAITIANNTIKKLNQHAQDIGQVIQLISEIAAQTNILALNAAIEAARAGDHGRGFDVVAEEIRKLAQRTTQSTKNISAIIEEIQKETQEVVKRMESGTVIANKAGDTLEDIVEGIVSTTDMVQNISSASAQQAKTSEEIADALQNISDVSRQTAQGSKEAAKATQDLTALAEQLKEITGEFKL